MGQWDRNLNAMVARGMEEYLWQSKILFKDYAQHVKGASERLKRASLRPFEERKLPVMFLRSAPVNKEELARRMAAEKKIGSGLVCAIGGCARESPICIARPKYRKKPMNDCSMR